MRFHPRMRGHYALAEPRLKPCPSCDGLGSWLVHRATYHSPAEYNSCDECGGAGSVARRVNIYRKRYRMRHAA